MDPGRGAHAGGWPAVLRRLHQQQHPAAGHRVQRPGPATGNETGSVGGRGPGGGQGASFGGSTGILRLFHSEFGGQISWLLPAALISLAAMLWVSRRAARTDRTRAAALLWGGWVLVAGLVFSYMNGIIHPYYMVALAPGIAALTGIGAMALTGGLGGSSPPDSTVAGAAGADRTDRGRGRDSRQCRVGLRAAQPDAGLAAVAALGGGAHGRGRRGPCARGSVADAPGGSRRTRLGLAAVPLGLALVAGLAGPAAYALDTVDSSHTGAIPSAGPQAIRFGGNGPGGPGGGTFPGARRASGAARPGPGRPAGPGRPGRGGQRGRGGRGPGRRRPGPPLTGTQPGGTGTAGRAAGGGFGGGGGLGGSTTVSSTLTRLLEHDAASYKWVAATEGSTAAAPLELATGDAVMSIGGFNGTDPWPTLTVFKQLVASHEIHDYMGQGSQSFGGGSGSSAIAAWVAAHFTKETVGGQTGYDLTKPLL